MPEGGGARGEGRAPGFELSGEERTFTVTDSTVIVLGGMGEESEASLSDIAEGSLLMVELEGGAAVRVTIMQMGGMGGGTPPEGMDAPAESGKAI